MGALSTQHLSFYQIHARPDGRLDPINAAAYLGLSPKTLANMRTLGTGPRFIKRGRIFYRIADLDAWLAEGESRSTAEARLKVGRVAA
jgi:hypothetical protein